MARINIEDSLLSDPRFKLIEKKCGDRLALGTVYYLFKLAQQYWCELDANGKCTKSGIPKKVYELNDFPEILIESELVFEENGFFKVHGAELSFAWLVQKKESSHKGGVSTKIKHLVGPADKSRLAGGGPAEGPLPLTLTPSLPLTPYIKNYSVGEGSCAPPAKKSDLKIGEFIGAYVAAFQKKFGEGVRPDLSGKTQGQIKTLLKDYGLDKAVQMIQVYLQMPDPWFQKKCYDFGTFMQNLQKVSLALQTGNESPNEPKTDIEAILKKWGN